MNLDHKFDAERPLASHCAELLAKSRSPEERTSQVAEFIASFCKAMPDRLQPLLIGKKPSLSAGECTKQTAASLMQEIGQEAANYLIDFGAQGPQILINFDLGNAVALTDRLFGGTGQLTDSTPSSLPLSANLALERIACVCAAAVTECGNLQDKEPKISSGSNLSRLQPFPRGQYCASWIIEIEQPEFGNWSMRLAMLETQLDLVINKPPKNTEIREEIPASELAQCGPFSAIPLGLTAVLSEMEIPLAKLAKLAAGDVLALSPSRQIPLRLDGKTLGSGRIGTIDNQVALQLTSIF